VVDTHQADAVTFDPITDKHTNQPEQIGRRPAKLRPRVMVTQHRNASDMLRAKEQAATTTMVP